MRLIFTLLLLCSCSSIPKGKKVMAKKIENDKIQQVKNTSGFQKGNIENYLTIYAHPQVINEHSFLKEAVFLIPNKPLSLTWNKLIRIEDDVK